MNKEEIKIITLGDIFRNLETEEQAFEFLKYIKNLQQENQKYKEVIDKLIEYLQEKYDSSSLCGIVLNFNEFEDIKDLLKEVE